MYLPAFNVTEVPLDDPENDFGDGLLPDTVMVKSEGFLVPPLTFVLTVKNVFDPIGDTALFVAFVPNLKVIRYSAFARVPLDMSHCAVIPCPGV